MNEHFISFCSRSKFNKNQNFVNLKLSLNNPSDMVKVFETCTKVKWGIMLHGIVKFSSVIGFTVCYQHCKFMCLKRPCFVGLSVFRVLTPIQLVNCLIYFIMTTVENEILNTVCFSRTEYYLLITLILNFLHVR